jgi:hypothetical protein
VSKTGKKLKGNYVPDNDILEDSCMRYRDLQEFHAGQYELHF